MSMLDPRTTDDLMRLMRENATGAERVNHLIAWDAPRKPMVIPVARLRELLDQAGWQDLSIQPIWESSALKRALAKMTEDRRIEITFDDREETDYTYVRLVRGNRENRAATHRQEETVTYRKVAKAGEERVLYTSQHARDVIEPLLNLYKVSYNTRDIIERIIQPIISRAAGFPLRGQGGFYCLLPGSEPVIAKLEKFLDLLTQETGQAFYLTNLQVPDSSRAREDMRFHTTRALIAKMADERASLKDMLRENRAGKIKPETVANYLHELDDIGQRASLYRQMVQLDVRQLDAALAQLRAAFTAVRDGLTPAQYDATLASVDAAIARAEEYGVSVDELASMEATAATTGAPADPFSQVGQEFTPSVQEPQSKPGKPGKPGKPVTDADADPFKDVD